MQVKPDRQLRFGGVDTSGHPLERPATSATQCENFRVMPGGWLQLRGGVKKRLYQAAGYIRQLFEYKPPGQFGFAFKFFQQYDGVNCKWRYLGLATWDVDPFHELTISTTYDSGYAQNNAVAAAPLSQRVMMYNGLGVRDANNGSEPPFTTFDETAKRYAGLDAYCPNGNPTVSAAAGSGNNNVLAEIQFWVGLYCSGTNHYSNAVYAGNITTTDEASVITVADLDKLKYVFYTNLDKLELKYVFYATLDGGWVPYLLLNAAGTDVLTATITSTSQSLSLVSGELNGFYRDLTAEMPIDNFPPLPMRDIAYVQGRVYGVLMTGGSGSKILQQQPDGEKLGDFTYVPSMQRYGGVVYSKSVEDIASQHTIGNHEECWPPLNFIPTPNGERPTRIERSPDGYQLLVLCPTATFLVTENNIGLHEWTSVSEIHGIYSKDAGAPTEHGFVWVTQRHQLVMFEAATGKLVVLSGHYQSLFDGKTVRWVGYWLDPLQEVDQVHVYLTDGTVIVHDFRIGGEAYTKTNYDYLCGASLLSPAGKINHTLGNQHLFTHLGQQSPIPGDQPNDGQMLTYDETYSGPNDTVTTAIAGEYIRQWTDLGDDSERKEMPHIDVLCDADTEVEWYADFEEVAAGNTKTTTAAKRAQSDTDSARRFKLSRPHRFWYKLVLKLTADGSKTHYDWPANQGDLASNFYGSVLRALLTIGRKGNRP